MRPLARLPVFYDLEDRRVVVAGGSPAAAWKAELLSAAGATVDVYAPDCSDEMTALADDAPRGAVRRHARAWMPQDLVGAALAIGACDDDASATLFADAARQAGVAVNVIDRPAFCDFSFGSIVNRSPLVIGISSGGGAPVFAQAVRAKLEAMLPQGFAAWADAAQRWRKSVQAQALSFAGRRRFWQLFTARALVSPDRLPNEADLTLLLAKAHGQAEAADRGSVTLVGAGPGDAELLTLRAVRALQSADVILFDDLVSREVLDFARREAKTMLVGKTGHGPSCKQADINTLMVALARGGKRVVRLKGGDPMIFGRAGEEIEACHAAGIAVDIVPGISAAQGAAARLGVSLTHRDQARRVQFVTGHGKDGLLPDNVWSDLADPAATTAVYMPARTLGGLVERALAAGLDPTTPAAAIANATRPDERVLRGAIADLPAALSAAAMSGPVLVMVGWVLAEQLEIARRAAGSRGLE